jgi:hypothetical protein
MGIGVASMQGRTAGVRQRAQAFVAVFGVGGIIAIAAGWGANPAQSAELSPAQIVAMRFPAGWATAPAKTAPGAVRQTPAQQAPVQVASASIFSPYPTYLPQPAQAGGAGAGLPRGVMAYADPATESKPESKIEKTESKPESRRPSTGYQLASVTPAPERRAAEPPRANPRGAVFNDAQITSIKERLNLTPSQERMWPAVEAALRDLAYKKPAAGAQKSTLDPNSAEVARLKSAAFPLVMSFDYEQKRELRTLAQLIGLGSVAAQF